ncbi:hypothetical protein [Candidatus Mycoplasma haematohominis]|uniref:hypothetical protein n=1 Tax=Candidatus Mycoplasma haematohominis TaxID=1494318 RepID=UPI001C0A6D26|nr:hypothetical protein [Candidatus Mycoplasma haemohominis]
MAKFDVSEDGRIDSLENKISFLKTVWIVEFSAFVVASVSYLLTTLFSAIFLIIFVLSGFVLVVSWVIDVFRCFTLISDIYAFAVVNRGFSMPFFYAFEKSCKHLKFVLLFYLLGSMIPLLWIISFCYKFLFFGSWQALFRLIEGSSPEKTSLF